MKENSELQGYSTKMQEKIEEMQKELKKFNDEKAIVKKNLETFDALDFEVSATRNGHDSMKVIHMI